LCCFNLLRRNASQRSSESSTNTNAQVDSHAPTFAKVLDGRKQPVRGVWQSHYLLRNWLGAAEGKSLRSVKRNEGKILEGREVAAHGDGQGKVTLLSPVLTV